MPKPTIIVNWRAASQPNQNEPIKCNTTMPKTRATIDVINPVTAIPLPCCDGLLRIWQRAMPDKMMPVIESTGLRKMQQHKRMMEAIPTLIPAIAIPFVVFGEATYPLMTADPPMDVPTRSKNSGNAETAFHCESPSLSASVCALARPSAIH
jgi:hypothetical protein